MRRFAIAVLLIVALTSAAAWSGLTTSPVEGSAIASTASTSTSGDHSSKAGKDGLCEGKLF